MRAAFKSAMVQKRKQHGLARRELLMFNAQKYWKKAGLAMHTIEHIRHDRSQGDARLRARRWHVVRRAAATRNLVRQMSFDAKQRKFENKLTVNESSKEPNSHLLLFEDLPPTLARAPQISARRRPHGANPVRGIRRHSARTHDLTPRETRVH